MFTKARPLAAVGAGVLLTTLAGAAAGALLLLFGRDRSPSLISDSGAFVMVVTMFFTAAWLGGGLALACSLFFRPRAVLIKGAACGLILPGVFLLLLLARATEPPGTGGFLVIAGAWLLPGALSGGIAAAVMHRGAHGTA